MLDTELDALKSDESALRRELESAGVQFRGKNCRCPFHDDRSPSAGIFTKDGKWFFKCQVCQVGGTIIDVRAALNKRSVAEELRAMSDHPPATTARPAPRRQPEAPPKTFPTIDALRASFRNVEGLYRYTDPDTGVVNLVVLRYRDDKSKKHFVQASPAPAGGYWLKAPEGKLPLYNRSRIAKAEYVVVVEGEKCVHALQELGIVATTSPGGALKGGNADWSPLAGKRVYVWPDFDGINPPDKPYPGERTGYVHAEEVQKLLFQLRPAADVWRINPELLELEEKGDAADFVKRYEGWEAGDIKAAIEADVLADAAQVGLLGDYSRYLEEGIAGKRRSVPFPWPVLTHLSRALKPGTVTCIVSDPSCGKSLAMVQCLAYWYWGDVRACAYMLEDTRNFHVARAHAQMEANADITNEAWLEANPQAARDALARCRQQIDELARAIWDAPDEQVSLEMLAYWVEARAKEGYRIIGIDPITGAVTEKEPWKADCAFLFKVKLICQRYGCSLILMVHPTKGNKLGGAKVDGMAGGAAYGRFSHTVLWLVMHEESEELMVKRDYRLPAEALHPNRLWGIPKARNGPGTGKRIAFEFKGHALTFAELGVVEKSN